MPGFRFGARPSKHGHFVSFGKLFLCLLPAIPTIGMNRPSDATAGTAPVVSAGGPYVMSAGDNLFLTGTATDPDGGTVSATWDLNGDGQYGDAAGATTLVSWTLLRVFVPQALYNQPLQIRLRATDQEGLSTVAATTLTVYDVWPIACFTLSAVNVLQGEAVTADASCSTHPDPRRTLALYEWYWGDHQTPDATGMVVNLVPPYQPGQPAQDVALHLWVTDDRGYKAQVVHSVHVTSQLAVESMTFGQVKALYRR